MLVAMEPMVNVDDLEDLEPQELKVIGVVKVYLAPLV